jgi:phosphopantetheinyl transferase
MTQKADFDYLLKEMKIYRISRSKYSFEAIIKICEMHGWTSDEFYEAWSERQSFLKLQGKI